MLVIIKSAPDSPEGRRGVKLARDMAADVCLIQNAVYFARGERLEKFCGTVYMLDEDRRMRGMKNEEIEKDIKTVDYDGLIDVMVNEERVVGIF